MYTFRHLDKVDWYWWRMSTNPNIIPILENNMDKVDWERLSANKWSFDVLDTRLSSNDLKQQRFRQRISGICVSSRTINQNVREI